MLRTDLIRPLPDLLRAQAEIFGGKIAFDDGRRTVSYLGLEARSRRLAGHLARLRVRPGDRVAMLLGNRVEMAESYFAIARAGAIGVPVNHLVSDDELAWLLDDSGARLVITESSRIEQLGRLRAPGLTVVLVDAEGREPAEHPSYERLATTEPGTPARDDLALDDIAWMLYTAGTTGRPKGVLSTQRNCLWSVAACYVPALGLGAGDRVLWPVPLSHSLSHIACVLAVTAVGARARIVGAMPAGDMLGVMGEERATVVAGVPTTYHYLAGEARSRGFVPSDLRLCLVGGAATAPTLRRAIEEVFGAPLIDAYGSTETCGAIAIAWPTGGRVEGSCGLPVPGLAVRLIDRRTRLDVPDGEEGEVWVRGPNVMAGYHNQPEATTAALDGGWYHTGDLARRDLTGYLTITGRVTELIIRAGENIHPAEIEDVLRTVPGVADAAAVGRSHEALGEVPVAFVVPLPGGFDPAEALAACREKLSPDKLPADLYEIAEIPRTAAGKIARRRLLEIPTRLRAVGNTHYESLFRVDWVPRPTRRGRDPATWAVAGEHAARLAGALDATGTRASAYPDLAALRATVARGEPVPEAVLWAAPQEEYPQDPQEEDRSVTGHVVEREAAAFVDHLEEWLADGRLVDTLLVVATRSAVSTGAADRIGSLRQTSLWGLVRSIQAEHPGRFAIADLDDNAAVAALPTALGSGEHQLAVRSGVTLVPLLTRVPTDMAGHPVVSFGARGTAVVTGADTVRGAAVANHLVANYGVRGLLLVASPGRGGLAAETRWQLAEAGAHVQLVECDLTNRADLNRALATVTAPVSSVVHAWQPEGRGRVADAFAAAATAVRHLYELTQRLDLSAFVIFSGASGTVGAAGQAHESTCAAFLDAFALRLRVQGVPALSIGWGPWEAESAAGTAALSDRQGLAMFDAALTVDHAHVVAMRLDAATMPADPVPPPMRGLVETSRRTAGDPGLAATAHRPQGTAPS